MDGLVSFDSDRPRVKTRIVKGVQKSIHALPNPVFEPEAACNVVLGLLAESFLDGAIDEVNVIERLFFLLLFFLLLVIFLFVFLVVRCLLDWLCQFNHVVLEQVADHLLITDASFVDCPCLWLQVFHITRLVAKLHYVDIILHLLGGGTLQSHPAIVNRFDIRLKVFNRGGPKFLQFLATQLVHFLF